MPNATMPRRIKEQGAEAERERQEILNPQAPAPTKETAEGAGAAASTATAQPTQETVETLKQKLEEMTRKFDTQEGRHGSTVQGYQRQLSELQQQITDLKEIIGQQSAQIETLNNAKPAAAEVPAAMPQPGTEEFRKFVGEQFIAEFGEEIPAAALKLIEARLAPVLKKLETIENAEAERQKRAAKSAEEQTNAELQQRIGRMWTLVEEIVPGARTLNGGPGIGDCDPDLPVFCKELNEDGVQNAVVGQNVIIAARDAVPGSAEQDRAVKAVAKWFQRFLTWKDQRMGNGPRPGESRVDVPKAADRTEAPKGPAAGPRNLEGEKPKVKQSEFDAFVLDARNNPGKYSLAEQNQRHQEYRDAAVQGRLIMDV